MNRHPMAGGLPSDVDSSLHGSPRSESDSRNCFGFYVSRPSATGFTLRRVLQPTRRRLDVGQCTTDQGLSGLPNLPGNAPCFRRSSGTCTTTGTTQGEEPPWDATPGSSSPRWPPRSSPPSASSRPRRPRRPTRARPRPRATEASTAADVSAGLCFSGYCTRLTRTISKASSWAWTRIPARTSAGTLARERRPEDAAALR